MGQKVILLFLFISACNEGAHLKRKDFKKDLTLYKDIDIYNLKGLKPIMDSSSYPYIEIDQLNDSTRNVIFRDSHYYPERDIHIFKKERNYWVTRSASDVDTCGDITYEYVLPNKIIYLFYCQGPGMIDSLLTDVTIFEDSLITAYDLGAGVKCLPGLDVIPLARNKCVGICITYNKVENGILAINRQCFDEKKKMLSNNTDFYSYNGYSNYWWKHFRWSQKKITCRPE